MSMTDEQRLKDRIRYANMSDEQKAARVEAQRVRKAALARERWKAMTPEAKAKRLAQIHDTDYGSHFIGNGIPDRPAPRLKFCRCCHEKPPVDGSPFCSVVCAINYQADIDRRIKSLAEDCKCPLPEIPVFYRPGVPVARRSK
jgi:hypothetical protein